MAKKESVTAEIVKQESGNALAVFDYGEDAVEVGSKEAGRGYEYQGKADMAIPFMKLCQPLTPIVVEGNCRMGDYVNTVSDEIFPASWGKDKIGTAGFMFVAGTTRHVYVEWVPRDLGGGYRGQHEIESDIVRRAIKESKQFGRYSTPEGNRLAETFYVYGAVCDETSALSMAIIAFESTRIRAYKAWMTRLRQAIITDAQGRKVRPPLYAHLARVSSREAHDAKNTWAVPMISSARETIAASLLYPTDERFQMAKACGQLVDAGEAKVDYSKQKDSDEDDTTEPANGDTSFSFSK